VVGALISDVQESGLLLVTDIDVRKNARKMGKEIRDNRILPVFRLRRTSVEGGAGRLGGDPPAHIHVHETSDGRVQARYREPSETPAPYENDALSEIVAELDSVFAGILEGRR